MGFPVLVVIGGDSCSEGRGFKSLIPMSVIIMSAGALDTFPKDKSFEVTRLLTQN